MVAILDVFKLFTIITITLYLEAYALLKVTTQTEAWLLIYGRYKVNCSISGGFENSTKLYWSKSGSDIPVSKSNSNIGQIRINENTIQLVFVNASVNESGEYTCHAMNNVSSSNATMHVHIGDVPGWNQLNCLYKPDSSTLWLFPSLKYTQEAIEYKLQACCSSYKLNHWCRSPSTVWMNAICGKYNATTIGCSLDNIKNYCPYKFVINYGNKYGVKRVSATIHNAREDCLPAFHQPDVKILLIDVNGRSGFLISWHLPRYDALSWSKVTVTSSNDLSKPINTMMVHKSCNGPGNQCTKRVFGSDLTPCTNFTICVENMLMSDRKHATMKCVEKATKNNDMPSLAQVTFVHNKVKKALEFYWKDPMLYEKGPFFYSYNLEFTANSSTWRQNGKVFNKQSLVLPELNCERGIFSISKCTKCGCGDKTVISFETATKHKPTFAPRKYITKKSTFPITVVVAVICSVLILSSVILIVVIWRRHCRQPISRRASLQELDDIVTPVHIYDEPNDLPCHDYEQIKLRELENL